MSAPDEDNNNYDGGGEENNAEGIVIEVDGRNNGNYNQMNVLQTILRPKPWNSKNCLLFDLLHFDTVSVSVSVSVYLSIRYHENDKIECLH